MTLNDINRWKIERLETSIKYEKALLKVAGKEGKVRHHIQNIKNLKSQIEGLVEENDLDEEKFVFDHPETENVKGLYDKGEK